MEIKVTKEDGGLQYSIDCLVKALVLVGAINWGLVGVFDFNLVSLLLGEMTVYARITYGLVGASGIYLFIRYLAKLSK